jgi:hypothetical protein
MHHSSDTGVGKSMGKDTLLATAVLSMALAVCFAQGRLLGPAALLKPTATCTHIHPCTAPAQFVQPHVLRHIMHSYNTAC